MKKTFTLIFFILFAGFSFGQNKGNTYVIKFKDKGTSKFTLAEPAAYLSQRSIEKRLIREIPLDNSDLPVNPEYISRLKSMGANVFYTSKWLNLAIAFIDNPDIVSQISTQPFVKDIVHSKVLESKKSNPLLKRFFMPERFQKVDPAKHFKSKLEVLGLDYGYSANQAQMLKVDQLHNQGYLGDGMIIGVMDAGFNSADMLVVFDSLFLNNKILGTRDFVQPSNTDLYATNLSTHGTMVLSTMGGNLPGQLIGTAPHASYYLFRTEDANAEYLMEEYNWVAAAEYADSLGVDIFNTSLGYTRFDNPAEDHTYADMDGNTTPITIGADMAASKGILVVNSAGNEGYNEWHYISAPADGDSVLTVGAVDSEGNYVSFSSVGPTYDGRIKPDVMAQGSYSVVAGPEGIGYGSGTSFSSPIMCGAAACLWQANPDYNNMEIINALRQSGNEALTPDNTYGWGIPDLVVANSLLVGNIELSAYKSNIICYPNPFNDFIVAEFNLESQEIADISLLNSQGVSLKKVSAKDLQAGENRIKFDGLGLLPKGIYFIQVSNVSGKITQKIIK